MTFHTKQEVQVLLNQHTEYRRFLYRRGFLITNHSVHDLDQYPFYGNWASQPLCGDFLIYVHQDTRAFIHTVEGRTYFLIGHAYDPFTMLYQEEEILAKLADIGREGEAAFWEAESGLTGVFCIGYADNTQIVFSTDCAGMQLVYHGTINGELCVTSHSKLASDLWDLKQDRYVEKLVRSRFYHYWGTWLPGDLSPFSELKRMQPNCAGIFHVASKTVQTKRYYPTREIVETSTEAEYQDTIRELGEIMSRTMELIAKKWQEKKVAIAVTGGRDSMTALACANGNYDKFQYFSYISNLPESVDAYAARDICNTLGLEHSIYEIPEDCELYQDLPVFKVILECNAGCIGENNPNDLRKRLFFSRNCAFDIEVKSWVNEMGRGWYYNKYNKKSFPRRPTAKYWRAMHKVYLDPWLIRKTNKVFQDYLDRYYSEDVFQKLSWLELYFWEFAWSGGEGVFLTSEHRTSYEITIPFNNRRYVEKMLTVPLQKRIVDDIPRDLITARNPEIAKTGVVIKDIEHTNMRARIVRTYLEIFSRI